MDDSQDDRHLHLERVQECQLVGGNVPYLRDKIVKDGMSVELTKSHYSLFTNVQYFFIESSRYALTIFNYN